MKKSIKKFFSQEDLKAIADAIGEAEKNHAGRDTVSISASAGIGWKRKVSIAATGAARIS